MLILQVLHWGPRHGYALSKVIRTDSGQILKVDTGSLYPALHRLERKGWVAAEWKASELGPRLRDLPSDEIWAQTVSRGTLSLGPTDGSH
jgi:PadR family transcriptional regulator, regulatory protein PadR